jgi:hypothetical protein
MTITTEEAERLALILNRLDMDRNAATLRSLAAERDALRAEVERLKAGGCARDQSTTQFCAEAAALQAQNARLREATDAAARALHKAGEQFAFYANQHAAKGTADGDQKAATNQQWAQRCFAAHDAALGETQ